MKKVLTFLLFATSLFAQQLPSGVRTFATATTGADVALNQNGTASYHILQWTPSGTVTTCQVKVEQSPTGVFGGEQTDLITAQTCTSAGRTVFTQANANFVRINVTTLSGGGTITATYLGFYGPMFLTDSSGRLTTIGFGASGGLAQSSPVFVIPNATAQATCCGTPVVLASVTTATNIKGSGGALFWVQGTNTTAAQCYLQIFDVAQGSVTLGTTIPKVVVGLGVASGVVGTATASPIGLLFSSTAISVAATTTPTGSTTCATGAAVSALTN